MFETATAERHLEHNVRLVYRVEPKTKAEYLMAELARGMIFQFPYSYRRGLEADVGLLLANDSGEAMFVVGDPNDLKFIGRAAPAATVDENGEEGDGDLMDFDMIQVACR